MFVFIKTAICVRRNEIRHLATQTSFYLRLPLLRGLAGLLPIATERRVRKERGCCDIE